MQNEKKKRPEEKMPAGTPWSGKDYPLNFPPAENDPPVSDPPVPNRAHTELRTAFPRELPDTKPKEI